MAGKARAKAKALLAIVAKPKDGDGDAPAEPLHGTKPEDEQCFDALAKAIKDGDATEGLACLRSLFRHFDSEPHEEGPTEDSSGEG